MADLKSKVVERCGDCEYKILARSGDRWGAVFAVDFPNLNIIDIYYVWRVGSDIMISDDATINYSNNPAEVVQIMMDIINRRFS